MGESVKYILFSSCAISVAIILIYAHWRYDWKKSVQRWRQEAIKFVNHMEEMKIDPEVVSELMKKMNTTEDFENANKRLSKSLKHGAV